MNREESTSAAEKLIRLRQRARTDLEYLSGVVLCYGDRKPIPGFWEVYKPVFESLQRFKGGTDYYEITDKGPRFRGYVPACQCWELEGTRNNLVLVSRNHLKTTFCTVAHTIQWILNYPDIRIKLVAAKNAQVEGFLREIKSHFTSNPNFRELFPEFCPRITPNGKMEDFGNSEFFTVPCRKLDLKEPTVSILSEGSIMSSTHYEVVKCDDLVDFENSKTVERVVSINMFFEAIDPLIERPNIDEEVKERCGRRGWLDVIGTPYNSSDVYATIEQREKEAQQKSWNICKMPCWSEVNGERVALWPERMSLKALDETRGGMSASTFSANYLLNPIAEGQGLVSSDKDICIRPRAELDKVRAFLREFVTVDMASLEDVKSNRSDFTAILHGGWDRNGELHMIDIRHGRFTESQFLENIFDVAMRNPRIIAFKFQKDLISSTFMPVIQREMSKRGIWLNIDWVSVAGRNKIADRIQHLEPLYRKKGIHYYDPLCPTLNAEGNRLLRIRLFDEIMKFPYFVHDDILDAQSDFLMHRNEISPDVYPQYGAASEYDPERRFGHTGTNHPGEGKTAIERIVFNFEDEGDYTHSTITGM